MSWEKLPFCGGLAAVLLTIAFIRAVFMVPDFDFWFWDVFFLYFFWPRLTFIWLLIKKPFGGNLSVSASLFFL